MLPNGTLLIPAFRLAGEQLGGKGTGTVAPLPLCRRPCTVDLW